MITNCAMCGKSFDVLYPDLWRYKRGSLFLCSWSCLRQFDEGEKAMNKITLKQKQKAVEIAISGGNPIEYLRSCGSTAPDKLWCYIKTVLKKKEPETFAKIPDLRRKKPEAPEAEAKPATLKLDGPIRIQTPEKIIDLPDEKVMQIPKELPQPFEYRTTGISTAIGDFQYFRKSGYLDWTPLDGNGTVSMNTEEWKELLKLIPDVARVLGVEL